MPSSGSSSTSAGMSRNSSSISNDSTSENIDWRKIEESLQDDNEELISQTLARFTIAGNTQPGSPGASETLILTSIEKLHHGNVVVRSGAMAVLLHAVVSDNTALAPHMTTLVRALAQPALLDLKSGRNLPEYVTLHKNLCSLINQLQFKESDKILPNFKPLAGYIVQCTGHENLEIGTVACEYWARLPVPPVPEKHLEPWVPSVMALLGKLVHSLLKSLIYNNDHVKYLDSRTEAPGRETPPLLEQITNRRNYAAMGLENLSRVFSSETVNAMKPLVQKWLYSKDWFEVEAMILALGAITQALGVSREMKDLYPAIIIPRLLECFSHPHPLVRSITCFTFQALINIDPRALGIKDPFAKVLRSTLQLLKDPNEEVQQMSSQCLSTMLAYSNKDISPYSRKLIDEMVQAEKVIRGKARFTYYECIAHIFGRMGSQMERDDINCLMVPFLNHWNKLDPNGDSNSSVVPASKIGQETLLLCQPLCTVAMYGKYHIEPYNEEILNKVHDFLSTISGNSKQNFSSELVTQKTVAYLDLASSMLEGQGHSLESLLTKLDLTPCVVKILQNKQLKNSVHQSCLALLGNISKHCYNLVNPQIDAVIPVLKTDMNSELTEIRNNAIWTLFNIIQNCSDCLSDYDNIGNDLVTVLMKQDAADESITVNATLALTALAAKWPDKFASLLTSDTLFSNMCTTLQRPFPRDLEKVTLYQNICTAIAHNLTNISVTGWVQFCVAAAVLESPDDVLRLKLKNTLHNARSVMGNKNWAKVTQQIGSQLASTLRRRYRLY